MTITHNNKFIALLKAISLWVIWLLLVRISGAFEGFFPPVLKSCIYGVLGSVYAYLLTWLYLRSEKKTFHDISLTFQNQTPLRFLYGVLIGAAIFIVMTALFMLFGRMHLNYTGASLSDILKATITLFWLALMEEIAFRSYPLLKLKDNFGVFAAQFIAALGFAFYHFAIGWDLQTVLMGPFVWGWVYGLAAIWSRGIALPLGIHLVLNIGQNLTGMSGNSATVWKIDFNSANHPNPQVILVALHAAVFLIAVGLTWYYRLNHDLQD